MKNESKHEDMQKIMLHLQQYVPVKTTESTVLDPLDDESIKLYHDSFHQILFGGDQLTVERAMGVKCQCINEGWGLEQLAGLVRTGTQKLYY